MAKSKNRIIIVFGPPGSGKGTQANLLCEKFAFYHWETSKIIGRMINEAKKGAFVSFEGKKYYFEEERKRRESGLLWSPPFIVALVRERIMELANDGESIVMTGSPRTLFEGEKLIPVLKKIYGLNNVVVVALNLSEKESLWRNTHRKECELINHSILYSKETAKLKVCPFDGSKLILRKDDSASTVKTRLREYEEKTSPLLDFFESQGLNVKRIKGEQTVVGVFKDVLKAIS